MLIFCSTLLSLCSLHIHNNKYKNIFLLIQLLCIYLYTEDYIIYNKYVVYKHLYAPHPLKQIFATQMLAGMIAHLNETERQRYLEKTLIIGRDPYLLPSTLFCPLKSAPTVFSRRIHLSCTQSIPIHRR